MKKTKKTVIIALVSVIAVWLIMGIVDFALVHSYHRPLFGICTESMQDGGSGKYVGLGYSFDIEGNFMPDVETPATEAEKPKVTSYRGYIFGFEVSRGFWDEMLPTPYKSMNDVVEKAPSLQGNVTEVYETYMIIHIVTSGYPYGADCSVSLTPVYGDSYTDVSVGDEVIVYFNGDIMETDPLQLGTIYAITLRTPANRTEISESDIDKLIYGDIERTGEPDEYPALDIIPGADLDEPGELVESITVEYIGAGQIKKWSVSPELIDDVMEWYADLDYKKVTFKDGESPADGEGQTVYDIEFSDGTSFYYYDCGQEGYIRMDGTWYKVKNPKLPPVGEPV